MSLLWYDIETFGRHPRLDRIAQFAAVRTDEDLEPLGDPLVLYCRIPDDYLPQPAACLITGITPQDSLERGLVEYEFVKAVRAQMMEGGTCVVGYNNLHFDDEFVRSAFYRNFFDPYEREWAGGNSRWDLIDVARCAHDLRPEGVVWPVREDGERRGDPDFRLESLARANGIAHEHAHDALSDVRATIGLARVIRTAQPKLYAWLYRVRLKDRLARLVDLGAHRPFVHTSRVCRSAYGYTTVLAPLTVHPSQNNRVLCWDLRYDPAPLFDLSAGELERRLFTPIREQPSSDEPIALRSLYLNRSPVVAPLGALSAEGGGAADRLGLDLGEVKKRAARLAERAELLQKVRSVYAGDAVEKPDDPELQIYSGGFFKDEDRAAFASIHAASPADLAGFSPAFRDPRLPELFFRFLCRNYPQHLSPAQKRKWRSFCAARLLLPPSTEVMNMGDYDKKIASLMDSLETTVRDKIILRRLAEWSAKLRHEVLDYRPEDPASSMYSADWWRK